MIRRKRGERGPPLFQIIITTTKFNRIDLFTNPPPPPPLYFCLFGFLTGRNFIFFLCVCFYSLLVFTPVLSRLVIYSRRNNNNPLDDDDDDDNTGSFFVRVIFPPFICRLHHTRTTAQGSTPRKSAVSLKTKKILFF